MISDGMSELEESVLHAGARLQWNSRREGQISR
jgi:hypothetical protein